MKRRSFITSAAVTALATPALIGMRGANAQEKKLTIALIPGMTADEFYITMRKGAEAAANALGVEFVYQGAPDFNPVTQVPVIDAVVAKRPDALLIAPTDVTQLIQPLKRVSESGIPVFTVDTYIGNGVYQTGSGDADFPISYIASDNVLGGEIAARALAEAIGYKGKVYVALQSPGVSTIDQRSEGFDREMAKHPDIEVLDRQYNDNDANKGASQLQAVYARNPDLAGVFGANLFSGLGAANGVQQAGQVGKIRVATFDAPPSIIDNLAKKTIDMAVAQHPAEIGYFGVVAAHAHLTGNSVPTAIGTGFTVINQENYADPAIAKFVYSE